MPKPERAGLDAASSLAAAKTPLASRRGNTNASMSRAVLAFPSLQSPTQPAMVTKSYRIPKAHIDELATICKTAGVDESKLVRDFIAAGLRQIAEGSSIPQK